MCLKWCDSIGNAELWQVTELGVVSPETTNHIMLTNSITWRKGADMVLHWIWSRTLRHPVNNVCRGLETGLWGTGLLNQGFGPVKAVPAWPVEHCKGHVRILGPTINSINCSPLITTVKHHQIDYINKSLKSSDELFVCSSSTDTSHDFPAEMTRHYRTVWISLCSIFSSQNTEQGFNDLLW